MEGAPPYENVSMDSAPLYENVENLLDVEIPGQHRRADADVRADVAKALRADPLVPDTVKAEVTDGIVTLTGAADHRYECKQAEFVARTVMGVADVENEVDLVGPVPSQLEVERSIRAALGPDAAATDIAVTASPGTVTLSGRVHSWTQRHAAIGAAAEVAGVRTVHDHLAISP
jgi:osmotically-inducible protein OsmY